MCIYYHKNSGLGAMLAPKNPLPKVHERSDGYRLTLAIYPKVIQYYLG